MTLTRRHDRAAPASRERGAQVLGDEIRRFGEVARCERSLLAVHSPEHAFYLGIESAARELLDPEIGPHRTDGWLDRMSPGFRDGYLRAACVLIGALQTPEQVTGRLAVPEPPHAPAPELVGHVLVRR